MSEIAIKEPPSVIADMAQRFGMDKRAFEATIRQTCMPSNVQTTNEEFAAFLLVAREYNLNPLTKEIFAFPKKGGGIQTVVSIDGWCNIINSHPQLDGIEFDDIKDDKGNLTAIACKIYRKDRSRPITCIEYMSECKQEKDTWKKWPARMLRHKALIQTARYAFGFSGIVDPDEAERMEMLDVTPQAKSMFKNATLRKDWCNAVIETLKASKCEEDIDAALTGWKAKMEDLRTNGNENDLLAIESIETNATICRRQFEAQVDDDEARSNMARSFGQGFAGIPTDEAEMPEVQVMPSFLTKGKEATA